MTLVKALQPAKVPLGMVVSGANIIASFKPVQASKTHWLSSYTVAGIVMVSSESQKAKADHPMILTDEGIVRVVIPLYEKAPLPSTSTVAGNFNVVNNGFPNPPIFPEFFQIVGPGNQLSG